MLDWWETSDGGQSAIIGFIVITVTVAGICIASVLLWRRRDDARLSTTAETTAIAASLIVTDDRNDCKTTDERANKKYALFAEQPLQEQNRNVYPNLRPSRDQRRHSRGTAAGFTTTTTGTSVDAAPDIMIQPNYGKQCFVSIPPYGIPGPESSV